MDARIGVNAATKRASKCVLLFLQGKFRVKFRNFSKNIFYKKYKKNSFTVKLQVTTKHKNSNQKPTKYYLNLTHTKLNSRNRWQFQKKIFWTN